MPIFLSSGYRERESSGYAAGLEVNRVRKRKRKIGM
jgi:hypothetical protein